MNENVLYDKFEVNLWKFTIAEWQNSNHFLFADFLKYDKEQPKNNAISNFIFEKKDVDSL